MTKKSIFSKMLSKFSSKQEPAPGKTPKSKVPPLKFVLFIIGWKQARIISEILEKDKVHFHFITQGKGTANSDILDLLGIGAENKALIVCVEQAALVPVLLKDVRKKLGFNSPGQGIAFTISLSAINDPLFSILKQSLYQSDEIIPAKPEANTQGRGERKMAKEHSHDLIIAVVNNGYSDDLMHTARESGATGGTVIHARGQAHEGMVKRFGISVQDEKEIILILCTREKKVPIMKAVSEAHGLNSEAHGIVFSLPVDDVLGLGLE